MIRFSDYWDIEFMQIAFGRCLGTQCKIEKRIGTTLNVWNYELTNFSRLTKKNSLKFCLLQVINSRYLWNWFYCPLLIFPMWYLYLITSEVHFKWFDRFTKFGKNPFVLLLGDFQTFFLLPSVWWTCVNYNWPIASLWNWNEKR